MRRLALLVLFVLLVGCVGPTSDLAGTPTHEPTGDDTVAYADLSPDERAAFDASLDGEVRFLPESPYVDGEVYDPAHAAVFRAHDYVTKDGTTYAVSLHEGDLYASYGIDTDPATPGENDTVVAHEDLSPDVATAVEEAVQNGSHHVPLGKWDSYPRELADADYVEYEGETYELGGVVGDYWAEVLTVERVR